MALEMTVPVYGEDRNAYVRLNNLQSVSKDEATALFRAFPSKAMLEQHLSGEVEGDIVMAEWEVTFTPDVSLPLWEQAYEAFKTQHPDAVDSAE